MTVQLPGGEAQLAEIVRILDQADLRVETLQLHQPSLDDVFLAKTGRKLEGAGDGAIGRREPPDRGGCGAGGDAVAVEAALDAPQAAGSGERVGLVEQTLAVARRAVVRTLRQRALLDLPDDLPADPVRDQRLGAQPGDAHPRASRPTTTATS